MAVGVELNGICTDESCNIANKNTYFIATLIEENNKANSN
jgi:hypothetical protein